MAYRTPKMMMIETVNRAINCVYVKDRFDEKTVQYALSEEYDNGFLMVEPLYRSILTERRRNGSSWTFEQGRERWIETLNSAEVYRIIDEFKERQAKAPKIISTFPALGKTNVDPALTEIEITFDKPMRDNSWSICQANPTLYPKINQVSYDESCTVLTVQVELEPERDYLMWFNFRKHKNFTSTDEHPLEDTQYWFRTGKVR